MPDTPATSAPTTPPPGAAATTAPNAPAADAGRPCVLFEPELRGDFVRLANGTNVEQIDICNDMRTIPDDGLMSV